mmetsp:Transcript_13113/g.29784  ORF Transcript_13113/g.29784 Transcript_13113/m.29784 type:complete len:98 (+) Transcript_13113:857-1150(+)
MVPSVEDSMEGCPENLNLLYLVLSALVGVAFFLVIQLVGAIRSKKADVETAKLRESMFDDEFHQLQVTLYGEKALKRLNHMASSMHSQGSRTKAEDA